MQFATKTIHVGQSPDPTTWAIIPPLYLTSTYVQEYPAQTKGYDYTRSWNPNFTNVEATLAALENGKYWLIYSSWLGALSTIALALLKQGDTVLAINDLYGWTYRLMTKVFANFGIHFVMIDLANSNIEEELTKYKPTLFLLESPTNPLLKTTDIERIAYHVHKNNSLLIVDNTFATPYSQQPLDLGADIVIHSTTKYLGGHSDIIGGATITRDKSLQDKLAYFRNAVWVNPNPFDARLLSRSLKTLSLRMARHELNAKNMVNFLTWHTLVKKIYYPWMSGIVSVEFNLTLEQTKKLISSFSLFSLAESLGGVESLVDHPASMTHASIPAEERRKSWLEDGLVRLSVGIEESEDLINDIKKWLERFL